MIADTAQEQESKHRFFNKQLTVHTNLESLNPFEAHFNPSKVYVPTIFSSFQPATPGQEVLPSTLLIVGAGVRPRQELAESCGLELGGRGGIKAWGVGGWRVAGVAGVGVG